MGHLWHLFYLLLFNAVLTKFVLVSLSPIKALCGCCSGMADVVRHGWSWAPGIPVGTFCVIKMIITEVLQSNAATLNSYRQKYYIVILCCRGDINMEPGWSYKLLNNYKENCMLLSNCSDYAIFCNFPVSHIFLPIFIRWAQIFLEKQSDSNNQDRLFCLQIT